MAFIHIQASTPIQIGILLYSWDFFFLQLAINIVYTDEPIIPLSLKFRSDWLYTRIIAYHLDVKFSHQGSTFRFGGNGVRPYKCFGIFRGSQIESHHDDWGRSWWWFEADRNLSSVFYEEKHITCWMGGCRIVVSWAAPCCEHSVLRKRNYADIVL